MRPSLRFLALVVVGWGGLRAATLGLIPAEVFHIEASEAKAPPLTPTEFPGVDPLAEPAPAAPQLDTAAYSLTAL